MVYIHFWAVKVVFPDSGEETLVVFRRSTKPLMCPSFWRLTRLQSVHHFIR